MKNRYLGVVCFLYAGIILYLKFSGILNNFIASTFEIYSLITCGVLIIIGITLVMTKKVKGKINCSDFFLLLPIVLLIFAGDGRISTNIAHNRSIYNEKAIIEVKDENMGNNISDKEIDLSLIDIDIVEANYAYFAEGITFNSDVSQFVGKTVKLKGFISKDTEGVPAGYMVIGKYFITCCVSDASYGGFFIKYNPELLENGEWYEVIGVFESITTNNGKVAVINVKKATPINGKNEPFYAEACYAYGDGGCEDVLKYNFTF